MSLEQLEGRPLARLSTEAVYPNQDMAMMCIALMQCCGNPRRAVDRICGLLLEDGNVDELATLGWFVPMLLAAGFLPSSPFSIEH
jgi:hypothetical protein